MGEDATQKFFLGGRGHTLYILGGSGGTHSGGIDTYFISASSSLIAVRTRAYKSVIGVRWSVDPAQKISCFCPA